MRYAVRSDKGLKRKENQDAYVADVKGVFAVADGMGGHRGGSVASRLALESIVDFIGDKKASEENIREAVSFANKSVFERAQDDENLYNMGTTLTFLWRNGKKFIMAHVGDSRCYLLREGRLVRKSRDHSLVNEMVEKGEISEEVARIHPKRNIITRALGTHRELRPDVLSFDIKKGDRWLICSDGLTEHIDDSELEKLLFGDLEFCADNMKNICYERGAIDNLTFIIMEENND